jgi:predicted permease
VLWRPPARPLVETRTEMRPVWNESTITPEFVAQSTLASAQAIFEGVLLAGAGFYLGRQGIMTKEGARLISTVSMRMAIPCLLFSNVLPRSDINLVIAVWPMLFMPIIFVGVGALLGWLVALIFKPPASSRRPLIAAVALGNSTGLPIVILSFIEAQLSYLFGPKAVSDPDYPHPSDPIVFLGVYLITFPLVQWVMGNWVLGGGVRNQLPPAQRTLRELPGIGEPLLTTPTSHQGEVEAEIPDVQAFLRTSFRATNTTMDRDSSAHSVSSSVNADRFADFVSGHSRCSWGWRVRAVLDFINHRILVPPVIGCLSGIACSTVPLTYWTLVSPNPALAR